MDPVSFAKASRALDRTNALMQDGPIGTNVKKVGIAIDQGGASAFDEYRVESGVPFWDAASQRWGMVYTGYTSGTPIGSVGLAWSDDLRTWDKDASNPIFERNPSAGTWDHGGVTGPVVWVEDGTYYLFYIGFDEPGYEVGTKQVGLATASSLTGTWTRDASNPVLTPGGGGWRDSDVYHVNIQKHRGVYYLFVNAKGADGLERIGYATSTSIAGPFTWGNSDAAVLDVGTTGAWDDNKVGDPSVYRMGDKWYMAYFGFDGTTAQDGLAYCDDADFPDGPWTKHENNPILTPGVTGSFGDNFCHKPHIIRVGGKHFHFYTTDGTGGRTVALAVEPASRNEATYRCAESTRNTSSTSYVSVANTSTLFDTEGKGELRMRAQVRCKANMGATVSFNIRESGSAVLSGSEFTTADSSWHNVRSDWVSVRSDGSVLGFYLQMKVDTGSVDVGQVQFDLEWFEP